MKKYTNPLIVPSLLLSLLPVAALSLNMPSNEFNNGFVKSSNYQSSNPRPVLTVVSDGKTYTKTNNNKMTVHGRGTSKCRAVYNNQRYTHTVYNNQGQYYATENVDISKPKSKSFGPKVVSLTWTPSSTLKNKALQACKDNMNTALQQGKSAFQVLSKAHKITLDNTIYVGFHPSCGNALTGKATHVYRPQPIDVHCLAAKTPIIKPIEAAVIPTFQLQHVSLTPDKNNYQGLCPATIKFTGSIQSNGVGANVSYRFLKNSKPVTPFKSLSISPGKKSAKVYYDFIAEDTAAPAKNLAIDKIANNGIGVNIPLQIKPMPVIELEVKSNNQNLKAKGSFSYTCKEIKPIKATVIKSNNSTTEKADLTSRMGITIGGKSASWGGNIALSDADSSGKSQRGCTYRMKYDVVNIGKEDASGFASHLYDIAVIHAANNLSRAKHKSSNVSGNILLTGGIHTLTVRIDKPDTVTEINEGNNLFKVKVSVPENCGSNRAGQPVREMGPKNRAGNSMAR